jgi:hypothetical protein
MSEALRKETRRLGRRAWRQGRGPTVTRALRRIVRELENRPFETGEPAYHLPGLRMQVRTVVVGSLAVDFAVCEDRPIVFIKGIKLLSM